MVDQVPKRITARTFLRAFEKMCNFIAVASTGDPQATVQGSGDTILNSLSAARRRR